MVNKNWFYALMLFLNLSCYAQVRNELLKIFHNPPEDAKPGVLWMWMGSNITKEGIRNDLEELKRIGFNRTTMFSLADVTTPWAGEITNSPTPDIIAWTEPWWNLVRFAAEESKRLGMDFGMFNGAGYESSGGTWITPELSMKEICFSEKTVTGDQNIDVILERPEVDLRSKMLWPVFNPETGLVEKPKIKERGTFYKDIAVLAAPSSGIISKDSIFNLTDRYSSEGKLIWRVPKGTWKIYRLGYTIMGTLVQPAQWKAAGFECDKMSNEAVEYHMDHIIKEIKKHLGDLIGTGFTHVHFDSYEAGIPNWTPKMREAFLSRRGYDPLPYLLTFAGRIVESKSDSVKFKADYNETIQDLYRDVYFTIVKKKLNQANLKFLCEPYGGPWRQDDIMPLVDKVMTEFWTHKGNYSPYELDATVTSLRKSGQNIIEAEAFTGSPEDSKWTETPGWLKPIGDAAFCAGVNRLILHRFTHQPWDKKFVPGNSMGQWGTHFDRTQTWWNEFQATVKYWQRCQALLQWGSIVDKFSENFNVTGIKGNINIKTIHRRNKDADVFFIANISRSIGETLCSFKITGKQPELWDPVTGEIILLDKYEIENGSTKIPLKFAEAQSFFIVFTTVKQKKEYCFE